MICCPLSNEGDNYAVEFDERLHEVSLLPHRCCECGEEISVGVSHVRFDGCFLDEEDADPDDGDTWTTHRTCASCYEIRTHFACGRGYVFGQLWEDLEENFFPDMKAGGPCMEGLSPAAKTRLFERRMTWWEEDMRWEREWNAKHYGDSSGGS